jgi:hypothetical protein
MDAPTIRFKAREELLFGTGLVSFFFGLGPAIYSEGLFMRRTGVSLVVCSAACAMGYNVNNYMASLDAARKQEDFIE